MKNLFCTVFLLAVAALPAQSAVYVSESITGTTASDWTFVNGMGYGPKPTAAAGIDIDGEDWLRLTADKHNQPSFVYCSQAVSTAGGLSFRYDFATSGARPSLADGKTASILWNTEGVEEWTAPIDDYQCSLARPENIRFGFAAGTGAPTSNQEVRNISLSSIPEQLSVTLILGFGTALLTARHLFRI